MLFLLLPPQLTLRCFLQGKKFVTTLITIWGKEDTEGPIRLAAFFRMRQMCLLDRELLSMCLRDCYVSFARNAKSFRVDAVKERIGLQARCLVELYSIDRDAGYRVAFLHIRQLALHVRSALASKTQESLQSISSWQFMHCLRLWGFILMENDLNKFVFLCVAPETKKLTRTKNTVWTFPFCKLLWECSVCSTDRTRRGICPCSCIASKSSTACVNASRFTRQWGCIALICVQIWC